MNSLGVDAVKSFLAFMLATSLLCACRIALGGTWDYRIGKFVSATTGAGLAGPVRQVEEHTYVKGTLARTDRTFYDTQGNGVRWEYFAYDWKGCGVYTHAYDARSFPVSQTVQSGQLAGPNDCRALKVDYKRLYVNSYDSRRAMTSQRWLDDSGNVVWEHSFQYDGAERLVTATAKGPSGDRWAEDYSYSSDARGTRIVRKHRSRVLNVSNDGTSTVIVSPQGRILEITNVPELIILGGGRQTHSYLPGGQLIEVKLFDTGLPDRTVNYSGHDAHGNWTVKTIADTRTERVIKY